MYRQLTNMLCCYAALHKITLPPEALRLENNPFGASYLLGAMIGSLCGIPPVPTSQPVIWLTFRVWGVVIPMKDSD